MPELIREPRCIFSLCEETNGGSRIRLDLLLYKSDFDFL